MIEFDTKEWVFNAPNVNIKVLGVGGAGGNIVNSMIEKQHLFEGIEFIIANTDLQALKASQAKHKIQLGVKSSKGLGVGASPELGRKAAEEDIDKILEIIKDKTDVLFLVGGMGGGTGSGALPVIAGTLKDKNILSIALVTKPFVFEGTRRRSVAEQSVRLLREAVDTLIVIPNQKILDVADSSVPMIKAFDMINEVVAQSVRSIADIIGKSGHINVDFADVRSIMKDAGVAIMSTASAQGPDRATQAADKAISSPLLENISIEGARGLILNISGNKDLGIHEISAAASLVHEKVHPEANIILGSVIDESLADEIVVTVIATGFEPNKESEIQVKPTVLDRSRIVASKAEQSVHEAPSSALMAYNERKKAAAAHQENQDLDTPTYLRRSAKQKVTE